MNLFLEILLIVIIVIILIYVSFYFAEILLSPSSEQNLKNQVCLARKATAEGFGNNCFSVELAKTEAERERGLMSRTQLDKNSGMLFIFDKENIYPLWMKNTLIPLDMIWIDGNRKVVFISQEVAPCKGIICPQINPNVNAKYVLEINSGLCKEIGLKLGDELKLSIN